MFRVVLIFPSILIALPKELSGNSKLPQFGFVCLVSPRKSRKLYDSFCVSHGDLRF